MAGLDAGHAYNTFPLMGGRVVPEEYWAVPGWRNAFENTAAVQFHHRRASPLPRVRLCAAPPSLPAGSSASEQHLSAIPGYRSRNRGLIDLCS